MYNILHITGIGRRGRRKLNLFVLLLGGGVTSEESIVAQEDSQKHHNANSIAQLAAIAQQVIVLGGVGVSRGDR